MNRSRLDGRVVAVTGAARGIGLATAKALRARGARVVIGDIDGELAKAAAASAGSDVLACELDVTEEQSFADFVDTVVTRFGRLDVLVNNAGIMPIGPLLDEPQTLTRRALDVNVAGVLIGMKTALPHMMARKAGHIVNVASVAGKSPVPGGVTYAATKAAIVSLTESSRVEFANAGVTFTCVLPSFTNTELIAGTTGTRFIRTVEPWEVGEAIAEVVVKPKLDLYVPGVLGLIVKAQPALGRSLRDYVNDKLGAYRAFLDFDRAAREPYTERIQATLPRAPASHATRSQSRSAKDNAATRKPARRTRSQK